MTIQKLEPYINVDPGTLNPYEHGELSLIHIFGEKQAVGVARYGRTFDFLVLGDILVE